MKHEIVDIPENMPTGIRGKGRWQTVFDQVVDSGRAMKIYGQKITNVRPAAYRYADRHNMRAHIMADGDDAIVWFESK